jgi:hypothetical protein
MTTCRAAVVAMVLTLVCAAAPSHGQLDQPDAVKTYRHIWETTDEALWEAVVDLRTQAPHWRAERASSKVLLQHLDVVERLMDAARLTPSPPPDVATPEWNQTTSDARNYRRTAYLFSVDATRLLAEGDADNAALRIAALVRMAGQLASEGRFGSNALAVTCIELIDEQIQQVCRAISLTDSGRRSLSAAFTMLEPADPAGFKRAIAGARAMNTWIESRFRGADAGAQLVESLPIPEERKRAVALEPDDRFEGRRRGGRRGSFWPSRQLIADLRELDEEGMRDAAGAFDHMVDLALDAWDKPEGGDLLQRIDFQAERGEHGALARLLPQGFARHRRTADRVDTAMERIRLALLAR